VKQRRASEIESVDSARTTLSIRDAAKRFKRHSVDSHFKRHFAFTESHLQNG
jgi:hypothetical protein